MSSVGVDRFFSKPLSSFNGVYFGSMVAQPAINPKTKMNGANLKHIRCVYRPRTEPRRNLFPNLHSAIAISRVGYSAVF